MARYTEAVCKLCRREGCKLFLKGERCYSDKCSVTRRAYAPGQHGQGRKKVSEYGIQLREKQKARRYYGVLESQFAAYYEKASRMSGMTGENLLRQCECRLDNIVYRLGLATSRAEARQLVVHGHFAVNGTKTDIPSYQVRANDVIALKDSSKQSDKFKAIVESCGARPVPMWLDMNKEALEAKVVRLPNREDIDIDIQELLIVEYYSK